MKFMFFSVIFILLFDVRHIVLRIARHLYALLSLPLLYPKETFASQGQVINLSKCLVVHNKFVAYSCLYTWSHVIRVYVP
jgi:hypothetical protein